MSGAARPLAGRRIVITRASHQAQEFATMLAGRGAEALALPLIDIVPAADMTALDSAVAQIGAYDYVILTSVNAVEIMRERLQRAAVSAEVLRGIDWVCVGPKTAAALDWLPCQPLLPPDRFRAEAVVKMLLERGVDGKRILYPRARLARPLLPQQLRAAGALLDDPVAYDTVAAGDGGARLCRLLQAGEVDALTFASSSSVENFVALFGDASATLCATTALASIGPVTSATARRLGLRVDVEAASYTLAGLIAALEEYFSGVPVEPEP